MLIVTNSFWSEHSDYSVLINSDTRLPVAKKIGSLIIFSDLEHEEKIKCDRQFVEQRCVDKGLLIKRKGFQLVSSTDYILLWGIIEDETNHWYVYIHDGDEITHLQGQEKTFEAAMSCAKHCTNAVLQCWLVREVLIEEEIEELLRAFA